MCASVKPSACACSQLTECVSTSAGSPDRLSHSYGAMGQPCRCLRGFANTGYSSMRGLPE